MCQNVGSATSFLTVQWADRIVEILASHFARQEFRMIPPKMHGRFRIGLPKVHGQFCVDLPKMNGRFRMVPPKISNSIWSQWISTVGEFLGTMAVRQEK